MLPIMIKDNREQLQEIVNYILYADNISNMIEIIREDVLNDHIDDYLCQKVLRINGILKV